MPNWNGKGSPFVIGNQLCVRHGLTDTPTHNAWKNMRRRCKSDPLYAGRGITVCERWLKFDNFLADMGVRPDGTSMDRIDNDRGYEPGNCRWAPIKLQNVNKRVNVNFEINGIRLCVAEWCGMLELDEDLIRSRIGRLGWPFEKAIREPVKIKFRPQAQ